MDDAAARRPGSLLVALADVVADVQARLDEVNRGAAAAAHVAPRERGAGAAAGDGAALDHDRADFAVYVASALDVVADLQDRVERFVLELRERGLHLGIGPNPRCVTCSTEWPCEAATAGESTLLLDREGGGLMTFGPEVEPG